MLVAIEDSGKANEENKKKQVLGEAPIQIKDKPTGKDTFVLSFLNA